MVSRALKHQRRRWAAESQSHAGTARGQDEDCRLLLCCVTLSKSLNHSEHKCPHLQLKETLVLISLSYQSDSDNG